jgi:hypothetical protein
LLEFRNQLWLLQHSDIRRSRRVKVVADALATALRSQRELIEGLLRDRGATLERRLQIRHTVGS